MSEIFAPFFFSPISIIQNAFMLIPFWYASYLLKLLLFCFDNDGGILLIRKNYWDCNNPGRLWKKIGERGREKNEVEVEEAEEKEEKEEEA